MTVLQKNDVPAASLTTIRQSGQVPTVLNFDSETDLQTFIKNKKRWVILGKGSNAILSIHPEFPHVLQLDPCMYPTEITGDRLRISAGTPANQLLTVSQKAGLSGLEFAVGVPASLGGMIAMNFGCWDQTIAEKLESVKILKPDGTLEWISTGDLEFGYRTSKLLKEKWIALSAVLKLQKDTPDKIKARTLDMLRTRLAKQPLRAPTFGSVFKNPTGDYAARLLEASGFKGKRYKDLEFSARHANFLINHGAASCEDIVTFIKMAQNAVEELHHIRLETEVQILS